MSHATRTSRVVSKCAFMAMALSAGASMIATAATRSSPAASTGANTTDQPGATSKTTGTEHRLIQPGDRNCLRSTGSLIPPKKGDCLPVAGYSYSRDELRNTGAIDNAHALQMLDPSIRLGH